MSTIPATASRDDVVSVSFVCRVHRRGERVRRAMLRITGKPSAPMNAPTITGRFIHQSPTYG